MAKALDAETAAPAAYHFMQGAVELAQLREGMLRQAQTRMGGV